MIFPHDDKADTTRLEDIPLSPPPQLEPIRPRIEADAFTISSKEYIDWGDDAGCVIPFLRHASLNENRIRFHPDPYRIGQVNEVDVWDVPQSYTRHRLLSPGKREMPDGETVSPMNTKRPRIDPATGEAPLNRCRKVLPMTFPKAEPDAGSFDVIACPDSGSADNIMSLDTARQIGCEIEEPDLAERDKFAIANGRPASSVGRVTTNCSFAVGTPWTGPGSLRSVFHIFSTLAVPVIMGMNFLERTKTFSKFTDRLIDEPFATDSGSIKLNSVGAALKNLVCQMDEVTALASIDSGSDLDFISEEYAKLRGFYVKDACHYVKFADSSIGYVSGFTRVSFVVGCVEIDGEIFSETSEILDLDFFVLSDLSADVLIGQDTIVELNVFQNHKESIISSSARGEPSAVNIIRLMGKTEIALARFRGRLGRRGRGSSVSRQCEEDPERATQRQHARQEALLDQIRNCELDGYRYYATTQVALALKSEFERESTDNLITDDDHESSRFYHCPKADCPRGESGKGFKGLFELVRHGLVHDPSDYTCPFCPSPAYMIGVLGSMLRHVILDHRDKIGDDPVLGAPAKSEGPRLSMSDLAARALCVPVSELVSISPSSTRELSLSSRSSSGSLPFTPGSHNEQIGGFVCSFKGCTAPPFQTQYLLNSHSSVHSAWRPHYCPVKGCSRSEGGKGFKRKNELIRHGLMHDSLGYICPFCSDREHIFPRPKILMRHVRVHHADKAEDDPALQEVLSQ